MTTAPLHWGAEPVERPAGRAERREGCVLCTVEMPLSESGVTDNASMVVAYLDDRLLALVEPGVPGVLLAPRAHVASLATDPGQAAEFLADLRAAVTQVQASYGTSGAMIEPATDAPGAMGHVYFRVVPTMHTEPPAPTDLDVDDAARLALSVRRCLMRRRTVHTSP